uniref:Uncharacterized protein n=1 Tax=Amphimedon queenslandica TaxID=400682 RepID=A0A1X7V776_AMPQE
MPRKKQSKRFEALHKARWTAGSSTAPTPTSSTIAENDDNRNEEVDVTATPKSEDANNDSDRTTEVTPLHFQKNDPEILLKDATLVNYQMYYWSTRLCYFTI